MVESWLLGEVLELPEAAVNHVILLSGQIASGKTTLSRLLADRFAYRVVNTRDILAHGQQDRRSLQSVGASKDDSTAGRWGRDELVRLRERNSAGVCFVVDSVRTLDQVRWVRETFGESVVHVHLTAGRDILVDRYTSRSEGYRYEEVSNDPVEQAVGVLASSANIVIDTTNRSPEAVLGQLASHAALKT